MKMVKDIMWFNRVEVVYLDGCNNSLRTVLAGSAYPSNIGKNKTAMS